ncbi:MAG: hypothetical protein EPN73_15195 [Paraburkholderia sp.]|nr:MAG: hypothetical protein EPN73_15195 [Paraburkholderia sp.]
MRVGPTALAAQATQVARQGGTAVLHVVETMEGIDASSDRIANTVGLIEGIAFQANTLALNASVEAARAGEQGRGFAMMASPVGHRGARRRPGNCDCSSTSD